MNACFFICVYVKTDFITALMYDATFAWAHAADRTLKQGVYPNPTNARRFDKAVYNHLNNLEFDGKFSSFT